MAGKGRRVDEGADGGLGLGKLEAQPTEAAVGGNAPVDNMYARAYSNGKGPRPVPGKGIRPAGGGKGCGDAPKAAFAAPAAMDDPLVVASIESNR